MSLGPLDLAPGDESPGAGSYLAIATLLQSLQLVPRARLNFGFRKIWIQPVSGALGLVNGYGYWGPISNDHNVSEKDSDSLWGNVGRRWASTALRDWNFR